MRRRSANIGVFICLKCSDVHRSLVQTSQSLGNMDTPKGGPCHVKHVLYDPYLDTSKGGKRFLKKLLTGDLSRLFVRPKKIVQKRLFLISRKGEHWVLFHWVPFQLISKQMQPKETNILLGSC